MFQKFMFQNQKFRFRIRKFQVWIRKFEINSNLNIPLKLKSKLPLQNMKPKKCYATINASFAKFSYTPKSNSIKMHLSAETSKSFTVKDKQAKMEIPFGNYITYYFVPWNVSADNETLISETFRHSCAFCSHHRSLLSLLSFLSRAKQRTEWNEMRRRKKFQMFLCNFF